MHSFLKAHPLDYWDTEILRKSPGSHFLLTPFETD